jgi:hypothetical protein
VVGVVTVAGWAAAGRRAVTVPLKDIVSMGVGQQEVSTSGNSHDGIVGRARDVLVEWFELPGSEAELALRTWSRQSGIPLDTLAIALTSDIYEGKPSGCTPSVLRQLEQSLRDLSSRR